MTTPQAKPIAFAIRPHHAAPLFAGPDAAATFRQLVADRLSHPSSLQSEEVRDYLRQAGLVNLWFFLKFIAGAAGPYDFLNEGVHLDLCNFRQSDACMAEGARACVVLPRGFAKTTICSHGGLAWEALRNPNLRGRIVNAVIGRAHAFKNTAQRIFDSNALFGWLYPEHVPTEGARRWNNLEMVLPSATKNFKEPTLAAGGSTGASEGDHHDVLVGDDLIGLDDVDANFNPHATMAAVKQWMDTNLTTLLISPQHSRVILVFTRYGPGDVYQPMFDDCKKVHGFREGLKVEEKPFGTWDIYYRHVVENGKATNPFVMTAEGYEKLLREKPLVAAYQYANDVTLSLNNEFGALPTKQVHMEAADEATPPTDYYLYREDGDPMDSDRLSQCHVVISVDWAGSKRKVNAKTSRTSIGVWARSAQDRYYRVDQRVGYFAVNETFEHIFELHAKYKGFCSYILLETNAMQLGLVQLIREEAYRRGAYLPIMEAPARGDKVVRIRTILAGPLAAGKVYLAPTAAKEFTEERMVFPSIVGGHLDVLDESAKAFEYLKRPYSKDEKELVAARQYEESAVDNEVFGW